MWSNVRSWNKGETLLKTDLPWPYIKQIENNKRHKYLFPSRSVINIAPFTIRRSKLSIVTFHLISILELVLEPIYIYRFQADFTITYDFGSVVLLVYHMTNAYDVQVRSKRDTRCSVLARSPLCDARNVVPLSPLTQRQCSRVASLEFS